MKIEKEGKNWYYVNGDDRQLLGTKGSKYCCDVTAAIIEGAKFITDDVMTNEAIFNGFYKHSLSEFVNYREDKKHYNVDKHQNEVISFLSIFDIPLQNYILDCLVLDIENKNKSSYWAEFHLKFRKQVLPVIIQSLHKEIEEKEENTLDTLPFDLKKCVQYVNNIKDFEVTAEGKPYQDRNNPYSPIFIPSEIKNAVFLLQKFLIECKDKSKEGDNIFLKWLDGRKIHWGEQQHLLISKINDGIERCKNEDDKANLEKQKMNFINFFYHNKELIGMIEKDVIIHSLSIPKSNQSVSSTQGGKQKPAFSIKEIALMLVYQSASVTRLNADDIIQQYGHNSGDKLYLEFTRYSSATNRKERPNPCTPRKLKNKIRRMERVIEQLPKPYKQRALDELAILRSIYESEYE